MIFNALNLIKFGIIYEYNLLTESGEDMQDLIGNYRNRSCQFFGGEVIAIVENTIFLSSLSAIRLPPTADCGIMEKVINFGGSRIGRGMADSEPK